MSKYVTLLSMTRLAQPHSAEYTVFPLKGNIFVLYHCMMENNTIQQHIKVWLCAFDLLPVFLIGFLLTSLYAMHADSMWPMTVAVSDISGVRLFGHLSI